MSSRVKTATENGLAPHFKVRIVLPGVVLHLASHTEPQPIYGDGVLVGVDASWIGGHEYGDTLGHIDWSAVVAVSWRWAP
jgi:hypothetical protein